VVIVFDDFTLNALLHMAVLSFVFFVEHSQLSYSFLQVDQFVLSLFDWELDLSQFVAALVDVRIKLVVLVLVALNLFPENLFLEQQLLVIVVKLLQSPGYFIVILPEVPSFLLPLTNDFLQFQQSIVQAFSFCPEFFWVGWIDHQLPMQLL
jgi:hypothetical protein